VRKPQHIDLVLAGHAHGGQTRLPVLGSIFVPSKFSRRNDCGTFNTDQLPARGGAGGEEGGALAICQKFVYTFLTGAMPMTTMQNDILMWIRKKGRGKVFTPKDFLDLGSRAAADQSLCRLVKEGEMRRLGRGL
jgi:hypothetical protein